MNQTSATANKEAVKTPTQSSKKVYQEWEGRVVYDQKNEKYNFEKLKCLRHNVKITPEQAETLNNGVVSGLNNFASMYFPAE